MCYVLALAIHFILCPVLSTPPPVEITCPRLKWLRALLFQGQIFKDCSSVSREEDYSH